jgi:hypothetical protein
MHVGYILGSTEAAYLGGVPPLKLLKKAGVDIIKSVKLSPTDEAKVFSQNARRLLKI